MDVHVGRRERSRAGNGVMKKGERERGRQTVVGGLYHYSDDPSVLWVGG